MADNRLSKGWLLAILILLIAQVAFIKIITSENAPIAEPLPSVEFDDQGRAITMLGDIQLHIPKHLWGSRPHPKMERDHIEFAVCWQNELTRFTLDCPRDAAIRIFLSFRRSSSYPYPGDAQEHLENISKHRDGPFEGEIEGVNIYRNSTTGFVTSYALTEIDPSGLIPFVSCSYVCKVQTSFHAQVHVQYHFNTRLIASWPQIHEGIRDTLESMIPGE